MRAFLGVRVSESGCDAVRQWRARQSPGMRWVADDNLHMTVVFLGHITDDAVSVMDRAMAPIVAAQAVLSVRWQALDWFPSAAQPRVLAWLPAACPALLAWQQRVVRALQAAGMVADASAYRPHISLARVRQTCPVSWEAGALVHTMAIEQLVLFRSDSHPDGVRYTLLQSWRLAASPAVSR
ncbi:MAG TPA: RNA 2',3'-cyclic phosphodiesterase [Pseudomonadales bacterium]